MEQRRFLLFIGLSFAAIMIWTTFIQPARKPPPQKPQQQTQPPPPPQGPQPAPAAPQPAPPRVEPRTVTLERAGRFRAVFDSRGAVVRELSMRFPRADGDEFVPMLAPHSGEPAHFAVEGLDHPWEVVREEPAAVAFRTRLGNLEIEKAFLFDPEGRHTFTVELQVRNLSEEADQEHRIELLAFDGIENDSDYRLEGYLAGLVGRSKGDRAAPVGFELFAAGGAPKNEMTGKDLRLVGLKNRYFALLCVPVDASQLRAVRVSALQAEEGGAENKNRAAARGHRAHVSLDAVVYAPGESRTMQLQIFAGPIRGAELGQAREDVSQLLDYTGFDFVGHLLLGLMNLFFAVFGDYGVAILFTTLVMRVALFPLNWKSQLSMQKMAKLQPKINLMRERYKEDQARAAQELWKVYREHKVNPMGGCLTMLIQLPIFLGMYSVLDISVDLRHSSFLWAQDLSEPDRLVSFGRTISILFFSLDALNLLPIIMVAAWVAQSMTMPMPEDPQQRLNQKIMRFMPIVFGLICYNLASGLSWYFFVNSTFAFVEQKVIKLYFTRKIEPEFSTF